ncbi:outer membrane lipoprotein chaperone LolA [Uliginosibacterium sp. sgz301328]|uniref:outer membrane lipoprotein chaperone LolA n=1 Tax=Uliginosibacterium sp. sgz301328 TaxID=3243764 RepID=UPI0035A0AD86
MTMYRKLIALMCAALPLTAAHASDSLDQLRQFLSNTRTARANFEQSVVLRNGKPGQQASGNMLLQRPGKFRWTYEKPYSQLIVGDGTKLWSYDKDLNQVVVKAMGQALGASPAALLAGDNALDKNFELSDAGEADGLAWLDAKPKTNEAGFQHVRMGFKGGLPQAMEVQDAFGQTTRLRFTSFERNPSLPADSFRFTPPKGADVVGE